MVGGHRHPGEDLSDPSARLIALPRDRLPHHTTYLDSACSMKITQDVREYARTIGLEELEVISVGLAEKAEEFREGGNRIYQKA